jgi:LacI family transcriptional regulator
MHNTKRIALLFDPSIGYCRDVLEGVQNFAQDVPTWALFDAVATMTSLRPLREWQPHGIIAHLFDREFTTELVKLGIPIVNTTSTLIEFDLPLVEVDHGKVGRMAATFFRERGYKSFGFFGSREAHFSRARESAFIDALAADGYSCSSCFEEFLPKRVNVESWTTVEKETESWLLQLKHGEQPTAIFAANDMPARYLSNVCRKLGIRVPRDVAILSVDNDRFECRLAKPALSSIEIPSIEIGRHAARLLVQLMKGQSIRKSPLWLPPVRIVNRGSTDATAVSDKDVRAFFDWLLKNFASDVSVDQLCTQIGVGRRTLERKLRMLLDTTINHEIRKQRIDAAKRQLIQSDNSIENIARMNGFSSAERFAVVFREEVEMSPTQFRERSGGALDDV